jgi:hypothetical protein
MQHWDRVGWTTCRSPKHEDAMAESPKALEPSTTDASKALAQTGRYAPSQGAADNGSSASAGPNVDYQLGAGVTRAVSGRPYERTGDDPLYRPLKIFALDPSFSYSEGAVALVNVPYEPLQPGPVGKVLAVYDHDETHASPQINLDDPAILIRNGRDASPSDRLFHQQMVYAVCSLIYASFRTALGRHVAWGFDRQESDPGRLRIRPHAANDKNAYYDKRMGELNFGYYQAGEEVGGYNLPRGMVYTCLSHDIVAHEVTHALLDGLRTHFTFPSSADVLAFHEGFADLVAIFQHFSYDKIVRAAIQKWRGNLQSATLLTDIARQFGETTGRHEKALRTAIDVTSESQQPKPYQPDAEPHALGSILVSAVFEAFITVFRRKTARFIRLATNGTGKLPAGEISQDLQVILASEASKLASQFLTICIRAIDYCPPTDVRLGEFLRAVITADRNLVPDDPWGYREAWIRAFRRRHIYPDGVDNLSEDALLWRPPDIKIPPIKDLCFGRLKFDGDPARPANARELKRQAAALGRTVAQPEFIKAFGLARCGDTELSGDAVDAPVVQSIRSSRRVGPDGQVVFDLVAEVTQRRLVHLPGLDGTLEFYGGSTVIIDPNGTVRYTISKSVTNERRLNSQQTFVAGRGKDFWNIAAGVVSKPKLKLFKLLHD